MGQEAEKEQRLKDFDGYQITEELCQAGGANPDWKFMHCLPRKQQEVNDEVRYPFSPTDQHVTLVSTFRVTGVLWTSFPRLP